MGIKELALDGTKAPFPLLGHQIDAGVQPIAARPFVPQLHVLKAIPKDAWFLGQGGLHQALDRSAHAKQVCGTVAENGQGLVKIQHVVGSFLKTVQS